LLSSDIHTGTANYKFTYSVEIVPVCKDDLVCIDKKLARAWGDISPLTICTRIGNSMHLLDPMTLQHTDVTSPVYWRAPFDSLATISDLVEFVVLDVEPSGPVRGKWVLADAQVARVHGMGMGATEGDEDGMGGDDGIYHTRTHLGAILQPGDIVLGYHLTHTNFNSEAFDALEPSRIPDVVLVKKTYPNRRKKSKARNWKLKSIAKEAEDQADVTGAAGRGALGRRGGLDSQKVEKDYELFLRDLEEDPELRSAVNMYKADDVTPAPEIKAHKRRKQKEKDSMEVEDEADADMDGEDGEDEEEEDFPEVKLDELLEHFEEMDLQTEHAEQEI
jgi:nonsense-mediated mRNA decay protein 3